MLLNVVVSKANYSLVLHSNLVIGKKRQEIDTNDGLRILNQT
jgi:hypothetical protein